MFKTSFRALGLTLVAGTLIGVSASVASGDEVVLRDGTVYTGTIVSQTRREVVIDTEVHGIRTRITLDRREVASIVRGETTTTPTTIDNPGMPTLAPGGSRADEEKAPVSLKREGYDLILEVPMNGTFGQDIYPLGIYESLKWAKEAGVTDIVFRMNSGGGEVWAAMEIVEIMDQFAGDFRYHALIEHAISATIWPAFNCDTITMTPGATFGGAVAYRMNGSGSAEVDKKMNSIWAAKLAASAEAHGHSPYLVHAMIVSDNAVYAVRRGGEWVLTDEVPPESDYDTIDSPDEVLTLTAEQAAKYGIAMQLNDRRIETWTEAQGIIDWDNAGEIGNQLTGKANAECKDLRNDIMGVIQSFYREVEVGDNRNSRRQFGQSIQNMRRQLGRYKALMRKAEEKKMDAITDSFERTIDVSFWENELEIRMQELRNLGRP
ncbi:MAG: hypothetical protein D6692_11175 [Planctomycetota bacterium]|nr:MAG: hypothetical protein D6692_11175 [Planctomycetota bacterium]